MEKIIKHIESFRFSLKVCGESKRIFAFYSDEVLFVFDPFDKQLLLSDKAKGDISYVDFEEFLYEFFNEVEFDVFPYLGEEIGELSDTDFNCFYFNDREKLYLKFDEGFLFIRESGGETLYINNYGDVIFNDNPNVSWNLIYRFRERFREYWHGEVY